MNEHTMNIDDLISQYIDGELSSGAEAELHHRLSVSPDDRKRFREQIMLRGLARDGRVLERPSPALRSALFARLEAEEGMKAVAATSSAAMAMPVETDPHGPSAAPVVPLPTDAPRLAADRHAAPRRERRRRLVPFLLPFIVGVIATAALWQFVDRDSARKSAQIAVNHGDRSAPAREPQAGIATVPEEAAEAPSDAASTAGGEAGDALAEAGPQQQSATSAPASPDVAAGTAMADAPEPTVTSDRTESPRRSVRERPAGPELAVADIPARRRYDGGGSSGSTASSPRDNALGSPVAIMAAPSTDAESIAADGSQAMAAADEAPKRDDDAAGRSEGGEYSEEIRTARPKAQEDRPIQKSVASFGGRGALNSASAMPPPPPPARIDGIDVAKEGSWLNSSPLAIAPPSQADSVTVITQASIAAAPAEALNGISIRGGRSAATSVNAIDASAPEPRTVLTTGLRQSMLVGLRDHETRPELALRIGVELGNGLHEIVAIIGYGSFRETRSATTNEFWSDRPGGTERLVGSTVVSNQAARGEVWGGAGYRINVLRGEKWMAGAGLWGGYGERYARAGADVPFAYRISKNVRIEVVPTLQYVRAHGQIVEHVRNESIVIAPTTRQVVSEQNDVAESEVRAGIGLGVTVVMD